MSKSLQTATLRLTADWVKPNFSPICWLVMGVDNPSGVTETQTKKYIEQAQSAADIARERIKDIGEQVHGSE